MSARDFAPYMATTPKRFVRIDLTDPSFDPIFTLAASMYPGAPAGPSAVVRELLLTAIGQDALTAARSAARRIAYYDALVVARSGLGRALRDVGLQLQSDAAAAEAQRLLLLDSPEGHG